jgi:hypothetical protein
MMALSLRQPWAHLVVYHGKNIENRHWNTRFRGSFLIHASKGMTKAEFADGVEFARLTLGWDIRQTVAFEREIQRDARFGGIVGVARLTDVLPPCPERCFHVPPLFPCKHERWFVLEGVGPLPFVPMKGHLGFFPVPDSELVGAGL